MKVGCNKDVSQRYGVENRSKHESCMEKVQSLEMKEKVFTRECVGKKNTSSGVKN